MAIGLFRVPVSMPGVRVRDGVGVRVSVRVRVRVRDRVRVSHGPGPSPSPSPSPSGTVDLEDVIADLDLAVLLRLVRHRLRGSA